MVIYPFYYFFSLTGATSFVVFEIWEIIYISGRTGTSVTPYYQAAGEFPEECFKVVHRGVFFEYKKFCSGE